MLPNKMAGDEADANFSEIRHGFGYTTTTDGLIRVLDNYESQTQSNFDVHNLDIESFMDRGRSKMLLPT